MTFYSETISQQQKIELLSLLAQEVTVCARGTYEAGTEKVLEPELLRAYNELLNRITGSLRDHIREQGGIPVEMIITMLREFGKAHNKESLMEEVLTRVWELLRKGKI